MTSGIKTIGLVTPIAFPTMFCGSCSSVIVGSGVVACCTVVVCFGGSAVAFVSVTPSVMTLMLMSNFVALVNETSFISKSRILSPLMSSLFVSPSPMSTVCGVLSTVSVTVFFASSAFVYVTVCSPSVPLRESVTASPIVVIVFVTSFPMMASPVVTVVGSTTGVVVVFFFVTFVLELLLPPPPPPDELLLESVLAATLVVKLYVPVVLQFVSVSHDVTL